MPSFFLNRKQGHLTFRAQATALERVTLVIMRYKGSLILITFTENGKDSYNGIS